MIRTLCLLALIVFVIGCEKTGGGRSRDQVDKPLLTSHEAYEILVKLPEVKSWMAGIKKPIWGSERSPADCRAAGEKRLTWTIVFEDNNYKYKGRRVCVVWRRFRIDAANADIYVQDTLDDAYITLREWRRGYRDF